MFSKQISVTYLPPGMNTFLARLGSVNAVKDQMEGLEGVPPGPQGAFMQQQQQQQQPGLVQGGPYGQMRPGQGQPGMVPGPGKSLSRTLPLSDFPPDDQTELNQIVK